MHSDSESIGANRRADKYIKEDLRSKKKYEEAEKRYASLINRKSHRFMETYPEKPQAETEPPDRETMAEDPQIPQMDSGFKVRIEEFTAMEKEPETPVTAEKTWLSKIMSAVLAAIILIVGALVFSYLWPDVVGDTLDKLGVNRMPVIDQIEEMDPEQTEIKDVQGDPRLLAQADKSALIAMIAKDYPNIKAIEDNPDLGYIEGATYAIKNLEASVSLTDNLLYEENGQAVYCDEAVIRCLAQFNSAWVDYINTGSQEVFKLLNQDGEAALDALSFNTNNLTETFQCLQIGEIRRNGDLFYVWTYEQIEATRKNATQTNQYYWIYTLIKRDNQLLVDRYVVNEYYTR